MLTTSALQAPKDLKGVFEIDAFKFNCVSNYEKTTGRKDGEIVFERERVLFMRTIKDNPKLEQCTRPSIYFAFVELFASGLTLLDGLTYIIPYKDTAQFQVGWKGRLEQMSRMPEVNVVQEPQVVLTNELGDFEYQLGEDVRILKHRPAKDRTITPTNKIEFVYLILDTAFGKRVFIMSRQEVLTIRDTYSIPYKYYVAKGGKWPDGAPMDPPFWITNEAEAFKKTIVKRAYKYVPKTPRQKLLDEKIATYIDHEDGVVESSQQAIDYGLDTSPQAIANHDPGKDKAEAPIVSQATAQAEPIKEKAKRSHKKKTEDEPKAETVTTKDGTTAELETGEVLASDGPGDDNPAADLPDLDTL
jgi:recombinational DNA repair protein RecT